MPGGQPVGTRSLDVDAPAKLNLGLRIVGRRDDGLHCLESVFVCLDLVDSLHITLRDEPGVELTQHIDIAGSTSNDASLSSGEDNLAVRAARAFLALAGVGGGVRIELNKRIPVAAGLGGGSSDAGAVLRTLDLMVPGAVAPGELARAALELGADVPFFLDPRPARVGGIGERIDPLPDVPSLSFLLAGPHVPVSTATVFAKYAERAPGHTPEGKLAAALAAVSRAGWAAAPADAWRDLLENDLTAPAESICPAMAGLRSRVLGAGALATGQSGSGATVFGVFESARAAETARSMLSSNDSAWFRVAISVGSG